MRGQYDPWGARLVELAVFSNSALVYSFDYAHQTFKNPDEILVRTDASLG